MHKIIARAVTVVAIAFSAKGAWAQLSTISTQTALAGTPQQYQNRGCGTPTLPLAFETWVQGLPQPKPGKPGSAQIMSVFNIPVIVHVIHNNEALNSVSSTTGGNLNAAQIQDQINILNKDFNGLNSDTSLIPAVFKPFLGKFQFNFCLAVVNPTGGVLSEPGIDRIDRNSKSWSAPPYSVNYINNTIKPNSIWDPTKYLNMWVLNLGSGLLGFATFPNPGTSGLSGLSPPYGSTTTDGLVMLNSAFGSIGTAVTNSPYHKGRTAVHELGHWLGLRHIWGDGTCATDYCADTPPAQSANYGCPTHPYNSGVCSGNTTGEMTMNYMDYTDDACMYMFTKDQKNRAQLIMTNSPMRAALLTSTVCNTPTTTNEVGILYVQSPTYSIVINCSNYITPSIIAHNFGSNTVTSATFSYNVDGVNTQTMAWTGTWTPGTSATITIPAISNIPTGPHQFNVGIYSPNGSTDPYLTNNYNNQQFSIINSFTIGVAGTQTTCSGSSTQLTASGGATSYTWNPGALTGSQVTFAPLNTTMYTISAANGTCVNTRTVSITALPLPSVSVNSPTICAGGSASVGVSGTACGYTWSPGGSNLPFIGVNPTVTTQYTVVASSCNGCSAVRVSTVTVSAPPALNLIVSPAGSICPGGTATITATGAGSYSWNTGATSNVLVVSPMSNTTYSLTGINGSCTSYTSATIIVGSASLSINVSPNPATVCAGNPVTLVASGANSYTWNTGSNASTFSLTPTANTTFTVSGTNGPCTANKTVSVNVIVNPTVSIASSPAGGVCAGGTVQLSASGASGYLWSNGATSASQILTLTGPATFTVTGSNQGCSDTETVALNVASQAPSAVISTMSPPCENPCTGTVNAVASGGTAPYTFSISGQTCSTMPCQNLCPALYTLYTIDALGCKSVNYFSIDCYLNPGIEKIPGSSAILVYPNPARALINIEVKGPFSYAVYNELGQLVAEKNECVDHTEINISQFEQALYTLEIIQENHKVYKKLIKE